MSIDPFAPPPPPTAVRVLTAAFERAVKEHQHHMNEADRLAALGAEHRAQAGVQGRLSDDIRMALYKLNSGEQA